MIYIYRNPKDVAVSYFHFARMLTFINYRGSFEQFLIQFLKDRGKLLKPSLRRSAAVAQLLQQSIPDQVLGFESSPRRWSMTYTREY